MLEIEGSHLYLDKEGALTTRLVSMLLQKQNEKKKNEKMRNAHLNFIMSAETSGQLICRGV